MSVRTVKRHRRLRKKIHGTHERPRLSVYRSLKGLYAQIIDDDKSVTLLGMSDKVVQKGSKTKLTKKDAAYELGKAMAKQAKDQKISAVVFDRGGNKYHGRIAEFSRGAREGGLIF